MLGLGLMAACTGGGGGPAPESSDEEVEPHNLPPGGDTSDKDGDGLCDATEFELGTDYLAADSDEDQLPDLIELASSFDPLDDADPLPDQLALLEGAPGSQLEFAVRSTVEGDGQSLAGWFSAAGSFYRDGLSAADYFVGATAVSADPIDAARSINQESARFAAVLGKTRLVFNLRFDYGSRPALDCGRAYPFRYAIKSDDGDTRSERFYLLVVAPAGATTLDAADLCIPEHCE